MNLWREEDEMKRFVIVLLCLTFASFILFDSSIANAQEENRYEVHIMNGRGIKNTRIPAMVLDTIRGIVWTCQNLQDGKPLWVKADLANNGDKPLTKKRYVAKMLEWQDADLRMPAVVLDTEEGIVWTCQNIIDGRARWIQLDLQSGRETEVAREAFGVIKE